MTTHAQHNSMPAESGDPSTSSPRRRKLILCFDGTSNRPVEGGTNIGRLFFSLDKSDSSKQKCYYQPGLGTYVPPTRPFGQLSRKITQAADLAFAWFIQDHIIGGYRFLMNNYEENDAVLVFGFSRGAYTARCLASMISCVGLLHKDNEELIPFAYSLYRHSTGHGIYTAASFRKKVSRDVPIEFMGLWDTVASVGLTSRVLPMALRFGVVRHSRQALALDECRAKFQPIPLYFAPNELTGSINLDNLPKPAYATKPGWRKRLDRRLRFGHALPGVPPYGPSPNARALLDDASAEDVWFVGSHSDVGGSDLTESEDGLSTLSLLWMLRQLHSTGMTPTFQEDAFRLAPILRLQLDHPELLAEAERFVKGGGPSSISRSRSKSEQKLIRDVVQELQKACETPIRHKLEPFGPWRLLEWIPLWHPYFNQYGERCQCLRINAGRGRNMTMEKPKYHWSVFVRMTLSETSGRASSNINENSGTNPDDRAAGTTQYLPAAREVAKTGQPEKKSVRRGKYRTYVASALEEWKATHA